MNSKQRRTKRRKPLKEKWKALDKIKNYRGASTASPNS